MKVGDDQKSLELQVEIPEGFLSEGRVMEMTQTKNLRDANITAHREVVDSICQVHPPGTKLLSKPQVVELPTIVENTVELASMAWDRGDADLFLELEATGNFPNPHQLMGIFT